jgi:chromosome partitioning protein
VFRTVIPRSVRLAEAPSHGRPVSEHAPASRGAVAYQDLADELLAQDGIAPIARDLGPAAPEPAWVTRS